MNHFKFYFIILGLSVLATSLLAQTTGQPSVKIKGELKQWHKVTLHLTGPFARETDTSPNPFTDYNMTVVFRHESGSPRYEVPGYFAADGQAGESGATEGNSWLAHLSPDKTGTWEYEVLFFRGKFAALAPMPWQEALAPYHGMKGSFQIASTDKTGRDFRAKGRLEYVGERYLKFKGNNEYFLKAGPDAPETLLAYVDFDGTQEMIKKGPLKTYQPHLKDWKEGDPTWRNGKGKGLIGALNYLAEKGLNNFSFLTYNAGGDGDNVWPFVERDDKFHYDCSKLDQWQLVFDYAQSKGLHLHFKTQENEMDDNRRGDRGYIKEALDGGLLGPERRLYYRELIARFGYGLALNWNLGEENTQSTEEIRDLSAYIDSLSPYPHNIVIHTFPNQQDKIYTPLLGKNTHLTGASLQNPWNKVHERTLYWLKASQEAGKIWVTPNDEQNPAGLGVPPDPGYPDFDENDVKYDLHDIRRQTLWGNLMAGGAGVEYYFGYKLPENDLLMEDFRSRDQSWEYCAIALDFFKKEKLPFWEMEARDVLIGNPEGNKEKYCFAKEGELYLVYLGYVSTTDLDLSGQGGSFSVQWFNPRKGGTLQSGSVKKVKGGGKGALGNPPSENNEDWLVVVRKD